VIRSAALGGLFIGVLSALPIVGAANCCCCLWIVSGGALAAYLEAQQQNRTLTGGEGAAVGALAGVIFPPAVLGSALVGAAAGGGIGHVMGGMSRGGAKELGAHLEDGQAALIVIGQSRVAEQLDKALTRAEKSEEREIEADGAELAKELDALPA